MSLLRGARSVGWRPSSRGGPLGAGLLIVLTAGCRPEPPRVESREILSDVYSIDRVYKSMQGPSETVSLTILPETEPQLVWVTGFRAEVVAPDGVTPVPPEFMCHSNLGFDAAEHARRFGWTKRTARRLFTVSQGQERIRFPDGFGIPLMSDEVLTLTTQVLNHNYPDTTVQTRVKVTLDFVRDEHVRGSMTPLYLKSANALVSLEDDGQYYGVERGHEGTHGDGTSGGMAASSRVIEDVYGRRFAGHWVVPPGRQETKTLVTNWMRIGGDATAHFIGVHLHPFAERVTLRDLTSGETVFSTAVTGFHDRIGLADVPAYSSASGLALFGDREYELTSVYDNTSGVDQEAMAVMYLYLVDGEFERGRVR